jgi:electron transfer flavoprotein beta subunit
VTELAALSVAGRAADPYLKTLRALGFARAVRVEPEAALDFAPAATAALLAGYARLHPCDVLLFGCSSGPGDGGTVPFRVAEALGLPGLTQVTELEPLGGERLRVTCTADDAPLRVTLRPPCVLAVGNALVSTLRVPTLVDRLAVRDEPVTVLSPGEVGVDLGAQLAREATGLRGLERIDRRRAGVVVPGATPAEQARALYDGHVRAALEDL